MMKKEKRKRERGSFAILLVTRTKNSCHEGRLVYVYEQEERYLLDFLWCDASFSVVT